MQIILSEEECSIIHDALTSEAFAVKKQISLDKQRGTESLLEKHLMEIRFLKKRIEPYVK